MNTEFIKNLNVYQRIKLIAVLLTSLLVLLLLIGAIWAATLPPAPIVLPSAEAMQAATVVLSADDAETHYLNGFVSDANFTPDDESLLALVQEDESVMASRPLFWAGRRPISDSQEETVGAAAETVRPTDLDRVELTGVYYAGDASGIIVRVRGERLRIPMGGKLIGWTLEHVDTVEVRFSNNGQQKAIQLEHARLSDYTPAAPGKVAPAAGHTLPNQTQEP